MTKTKLMTAFKIAAVGGGGMGAMFGGMLALSFGPMLGATFGACLASGFWGLMVSAGGGGLTLRGGVVSSAPIGALCGFMLSWLLLILFGDQNHVVAILIGGSGGALGGLLGLLPPLFLDEYLSSLTGAPRGQLGKACIGSEIPPQNAWPALSRAGMRRALRHVPTETVNRAEQERSTTQPTDTVQCTVFAPREVLPLDFFFLQAFLHMESQASEARADALEFDETAVRKGVRSLGCDIPVGAKVMFELSLPGILLEKPVEVLIWRGRPEAVQFVAQVPEGAPPRTLIGTVLIILDSVPLGHIKFRLSVCPKRVPEPAQPIGDDVRHYTSAFVSYASEDRAEVLPRVQMLKATGIQCFQDILNLDPGSRWEKELYRHIEKSDLFLLFWSSAAKRSQWVKKETLYALRLKAGDDCHPPEMRPVLIEGPPIPAPWAELRHLHFNDAILYLAALEGKSRPVSN